MHELFGSLKTDQQDLVRETDPQEMALLDEDELLALHSRIRKARNKHTKNYRRRAAARVEEVGARGEARPKNRRAAEKAEVFEDALARVSHEVDLRARQAAEELKAERLAAARAGRSTGPDSVTAGGAGSDGVGPGRQQPATKSAAGRKRTASTRAEGARRQAKRDSR
ncbi:MAG: hypothetical protein L0H79_12190 [Intrasporangium sp.]|uniref:hypothetical protein n=1 Tax=Intrasporangium sp. TaxID=1925024 RepID=UPI00264915EE|nr:hypothetical protein [Intrasporangium sp.]MDN5796498.1 hypothetical protein [Intrasporangium sp.]